MAELSPVGLGTWKLGGRPPAQPGAEIEVWTAIIHEALEAGITWLDTAGVYGLGDAERKIGQVLARLPESERPTVVTKCGVTWTVEGSAVRTGHHLDAATIRRQCEESLKRLGVDCLDVLLCHWPDAHGVPVEESWGAMQELVHEGKVAEVGVSNFSATQLQSCHAVAPVRLHQIEVSPLGPTPLLGEQVEWGLANDCVHLGYGVFGSGELLKPEAPTADGVVLVRRHLQRLSEACGEAIPALLSSLALKRIGRGSIVVGASKPSQITGIQPKELPTQVLEQLLSIPALDDRP